MGSLPPGGRLAVVQGSGLWMVGSDGQPVRLATGAGGWLQDPAWSPDGAVLIYTHVRTPLRLLPGPGLPAGMVQPTGDLYLVRPSEPGTAPVLAVEHEAPGEQLVSAAWWPDSRGFFLVRTRPGDAGAPGTADLLRVDRDGGTRTVIETGTVPAQVAVAPDGTVAVLGGIGAPVASGAPMALVLIRPSGERTVLATTTRGFDVLGWPRFSPDGRQLAFGASGPGPSGRSAGGTWNLRTLGPRTALAHGPPSWLWIANLDLGELRRTPSEGLDDLAGIAWIAGGTELLALDADGLTMLNSETGATTRVPGITGSAFAWTDS